MNDQSESVILSWSGGKDSAIALETLRGDSSIEVVGLLTTIQETDGQVPMHGVSREFIEVQARRLNLPAEIVELPEMPSNAVYEERMGKVLAEMKADGIETVAFGDLFLEDVRQYREEQMNEAGMKSVFPLWGKSTDEMARRFVDEGWRATITCVDTGQLDSEFLGREFDETLLSDLPDDVDPCAENGEFHTFVWDGPLFSEPVNIESGGVRNKRGRFRFLEVAMRDENGE